MLLVIYLPRRTWPANRKIMRNANAENIDREPINPKKEEHLTIEDIREIPGYENLPEAELDRVLLQLRQFALYIYEFHAKQNYHEKH